MGSVISGSICSYRACWRETFQNITEVFGKWDEEEMERRGENEWAVLKRDLKGGVI
jgi:hypothetical protein